MNIKDMNIVEISKHLQHYVTDFFKGCKLSGLEDGMFAESYSFDFAEVKHLIPLEYHGLYNDSDLFNGASGYVLFDTKSDDFKGSLYTIMLLVNADYSKALLLFLQEENDVTHTNNNILLIDFLKHDLIQPS